MWIRLQRLIRMLGRDALVLWFACRHPATPPFARLAAFMLALYLVNPFDLIPDWLPLLGWIDDATLLALMLPLLLRLMPPAVRSDAQDAASRLLEKWRWRRSAPRP